MQLRNSVAILTGASRGIGVVLAEHLARKGVNLALAARSEADLEKTAERVRVYGVRAITVPTDVQNNADLQNLVDRTTAELGPIDLLINNAGIESYSRFHESDPKKIEDILRTNVIAVELLTRFALPGDGQTTEGPRRQHLIGGRQDSGSLQHRLFVLQARAGRILVVSA